MKNLAVALGLMLVSFPAYAMDGRGLVELVVTLLILGIVCGLLYYLVDKAPFIDPVWKSAIKYVILFIAVIFVINALLGLMGRSFIRF